MGLAELVSGGCLGIPCPAPPPVCPLQALAHHRWHAGRKMERHAERGLPPPRPCPVPAEEARNVGTGSRPLWHLWAFILGLHRMDVDYLVSFFPLFRFHKLRANSYRDSLEMSWGQAPLSSSALCVFSFPRATCFLLAGLLRAFAPVICIINGRGKMCQTSSTDFSFCFRLYCEFEMALLMIFILNCDILFIVKFYIFIFKNILLK